MSDGYDNEAFGCVFVSGYDPDMNQEMLKKELETLSGYVLFVV